MFKSFNSKYSPKIKVISKHKKSYKKNKRQRKEKPIVDYSSSNPGMENPRRERTFTNKIKDLKNKIKNEDNERFWKYKAKDKLFQLQNNSFHEISRFSEPQKYFNEDLQTTATSNPFQSNEPSLPVVSMGRRNERGRRIQKDPRKGSLTLSRQIHLSQLRKKPKSHSDLNNYSEGRIDYDKNTKKVFRIKRDKSVSYNNYCHTYSNDRNNKVKTAGERKKDIREEFHATFGNFNPILQRVRSSNPESKHPSAIKNFTPNLPNFNTGRNMGEEEPMHPMGINFDDDNIFKVEANHNTITDIRNTPSVIDIHYSQPINRANTKIIVAKDNILQPKFQSKNIIQDVNKRNNVISITNNILNAIDKLKSSGNAIRLIKNESNRRRL